VIFDQRLESLSRVSLKSRDQIGVFGLHVFDEAGELLHGSCDGISVFH
jgi:hypothetical protein